MNFLDTTKVVVVGYDSPDACLCLPFLVASFLRLLGFELLRRQPECADCDRDADRNNVQGQYHGAYQIREVDMGSDLCPVIFGQRRFPALL